MNLTEWAHAQGIHVRTAYRWYREGTLPVPPRKAGRLILVSPETAAAPGRPGAVGLYARVSSHDRKTDPGRQAARLSSRAAQAGLPAARAGAGSGMYGARAKARRLLAGPAVTVAVGCAQRDIGPQAAAGPGGTAG